MCIVYHFGEKHDIHGAETTLAVCDGGRSCGAGGELVDVSAMEGGRGVL